MTDIEGYAASAGMGLSWGTDSAWASEAWDRTPQIGDGFGLGLRIRWLPSEGMTQEAEEAPLFGHFCPARACSGLMDGVLII
ncbi:MAG: hypothetical protein WA741_32580 [Candidatus Sulfotelmatobacter sp.]